MTPGDTLTVEATDPSSRRALPKLCRRAGFNLVSMEEKDGVVRFLIRKEAPVDKPLQC